MEYAGQERAGVKGRRWKEGSSHDTLFEVFSDCPFGVFNLCAGSVRTKRLFRGGYMGGGFGPGYYPGGFYGYGPYYGARYYPVSPVGEVQILTKQKGNQIFVDGGFAGCTGELKKFPLRTGMHTIEFRDAKGQSYYKEQIDVLAGKKLKIQSDHIG
jgi:hypothetical protein